MASINQLIAQIRFELDQLSAANGQHQFEHICRHIARARICSNILPATGPVSAGGDQGRDFETFRTYLASSPIAESTFVGLVSNGPIAFACTITGKKNLTPKIKSDISKIMASGEPVVDIHYFCVADVPVAKRHELKEWAKNNANVTLEIHDGQAISEYMSALDLFWIAEEYLNIPSELYPSPLPNIEDEWYQKSLDTWKKATEIPSNYADFTQIKAALRHATYSDNVKKDLPFWIKLLESLEQAAPVISLKNKAVYEIAVARLRGLGSLNGYEQKIRDYFTNIDTTTDFAELEDLRILWTFCVGAVYRNLVEFSYEEMSLWRDKLISRIERELKASDSPGRRCILLQHRGDLYLFPPPGSEDLPDVKSAIVCWLELAELAKDAYLFPLDSFSDTLTLFLEFNIGEVSSIPDFRKLTRLVDDLLSTRHGAFVAAENCRHRAVVFYKKQEFQRALSEIHEAKIKWYAEETLKGSILATLFTSQCYQQLGLIFAAKYYALAAAQMALTARDDSLKVYVPNALTEAACCDFIQGAFCSFFDLSDIMLISFQAFNKETDAADVTNDINRTLFHSSSIHFFSTHIAPELTDYFDSRVAKWHGLKEDYDEIIRTSEKAWRDNILPQFWQTLEDQMIDYPFNDLGVKRIVRFKALGISWKFTWGNTYENTMAAEEFLATLQILLADFADVDLCLIRTNVEVEFYSIKVGKTSAEPLPSNSSSLWKVTTLISEDADIIDLISAAVTLLSNASLLPQETFLRHLENVFENGLSSKTLFVHRYSSLYKDFINEESFMQSDRTAKIFPLDNQPFNPKIPHQLPWYDGPGPGYSIESAKEQLKLRYQNTMGPIVHTLPRLLLEPSFKTTVANLKQSGWLDWQILNVLAQAVVNYRVHRQIPLVKTSEDMELFSKLFFKLINQEEDANSEPIPIDEFSEDKLRFGLNSLMASTLKVTGLTTHQMTPDFKAIRDFLEHRYNYFRDDIEHANYGF